MFKLLRGVIGAALFTSVAAHATNPICDSEYRCLSQVESQQYLQAIEHIEKAEWAEAEVLLAALYGANGQNLVIVNNYAAVLARQEKMSNASYVLESYLDNDPHRGTVFRNLVQTYAYLSGDTKAADNQLRMITAYRPQTLPGQSDFNGAPQYATEEDRVKARLIDLMNTWQSGNAAKFLQFYWPETSPVQGKSYETWAEERKARIRPGKDINIDLSRIRVNMMDNGDITTEFTQRYSSKGYNDRSRKRLVWRMHSKHWLIVSEEQI